MALALGQIAKQPACEMVWWFAKSSEQYRIAGRLQLVGAADTDSKLQARVRAAQTKGGNTDASR